VVARATAASFQLEWYSGPGNDQSIERWAILIWPPGFVWNAVNPLSVVSISGTITYQDSVTGVQKRYGHAQWHAVQAQPTTDASGNYSFLNLPTAPIRSLVARTGDVNGISNVDATGRQRQKAAGTITLSPNKTIAADATNDGSVSNLDANAYRPGRGGSL